MKVSAQFNFRVDVKDEASPKVRTVKDDTKLKKVIKNDFFDFFQLDLIECDVTVTSKMKSYENGIRAMARLNIYTATAISIFLQEKIFSAERLIPSSRDLRASSVNGGSYEDVRVLKFRPIVAGQGSLETKEEEATPEKEQTEENTAKEEKEE